MISVLRRNFVITVMALVGAVMAGMLINSYINAYRTQWDIVNNSLRFKLEQDDVPPIIGGEQPALPSGGPEDEHGVAAGRLVASVTIAADGSLIASSNEPTLVDVNVLEQITSEALSKESDHGRLPDTHVSWSSRATDEGGMVIAIADTTDVDASLQSQLTTSILTFVFGLAALFAIVWPLSTRILQPVQQAWEQQRRFVSDASHELKTPLAVIVANMGILQQSEAVGPEAQRWIESSVDAAGQMQGLVGELLELARTDETNAGDKGAMRSVDVDLSDMVESAALEFDAVAFEKGCLIDSDIDEGIHLEGDPDWLERMVKILIDNAVKYADHDTTVTVTLKQGASRAVAHGQLVVNDHGQVIPPDDLAHIFDRFYRSDEARSRSTGGFGLGLAIAKGIAEAHGGTIAATSTEADGTTFTATL